MSSFAFYRRLRFPITFCIAILALVATTAGAGPLFESGYTSYYVRTISYSWDVGDVNGDGHLDFAALVSNGPVIRIALGQGDGLFGSKIDVPMPSSSQIVRLADLNGDGKLDLIVGGGIGDGVTHVALGHGDGTFGPYADVGLSFDLIVAGDVNGDGKLDLVSDLRSSPNHLNVYLGHGDGTFGSAIDFDAGSQISSVALGDANGDGHPDLLLKCISPAADLAFASGHGDGTFGPPQHFGVQDYNFFGERAFLIDLNGDGKLDAVGGSQRYLGNGDGTFGPGSDVGFYVMAVADWNQDGVPDLLGFDTDYRTFSALGTGDGGFLPPAAVSSAYSETDPVVGDFNGDGRPDYLTSEDGFGFMFVHLGNGDGSFGHARSYPTGPEPLALALADFNGDGVLDVVTANHSGASVSILLGSGDGAFGPHSDFAVGSAPRAVAVGDLNGDGRQDIVSASENTATISVLLGAGSGSFPSRADFSTGAVPTDVAIADLDEDGKLDVVTCNMSSSNVSFVRGDGLGGFAPAVSFPVGGNPGAVAVGDLNGDGHLDVLTYNRGFQNSVSVLLGDGHGGFAAHHEYFTPSAVEAYFNIALADLNHDGHLDVVAADRLVTTVLLGDGTGALGSPKTSFRLAQLRGMALADIDLDGQLDIVAASDGDCTWVTRGHGDGTFGDLVQGQGVSWDFTAGYGSNPIDSDVAVGDVNGDGLPDLVVTSAYDSVVSVMLHAPDVPVPVTASLVSAEADGGVAHLTWLLSGAAGSRATVYRREASANWSALGDIFADARGMAKYEDRNVAPGVTYDYRLGVRDAIGEIFVGQTRLSIPSGATLAFVGLKPNPASGDLVAAFSLPDGGPAVLEMFDIAGRRVLSRQVGSLGAGNHLLKLAPDRPLGSGLYFLRLTKNDKSIVVRANIIR